MILTNDTEISWSTYKPGNNVVFKSNSYQHTIGTVIPLVVVVRFQTL